VIRIGAFGKKTPFHAARGTGRAHTKGNNENETLTHHHGVDADSYRKNNGHTFWRNPLINGHMMMGATSIRLRDCLLTGQSSLGEETGECGNEGRQRPPQEQEQDR
jgi:hypothetical protein